MGPGAQTLKKVPFSSCTKCALVLIPAVPLSPQASCVKHYIASRTVQGVLYKHSRRCDGIESCTEAPHRQRQERERQRRRRTQMYIKEERRWTGWTWLHPCRASQDYDAMGACVLRCFCEAALPIS